MHSSSVCSTKTLLPADSDDYEGDVMNLLDEMYFDAEKNRAQYEFQLIEGAREDGEYRGLIKGRAEGRAQGRAEGRAEGRAQARAEGRAEGRSEMQFEIARNCLMDGLSPEVVSRNTGLDLETVLSIQSQYQ